MIEDILNIAWKEFREILTFGDARGRSKFGLLVFIIIFGIILPLQSGRDWADSASSILVWAWMPFIWVSGIVADLFAGERERHTLESLLATRLSDQAILFGKLLAALAYGFLLTWVIMLVSLVTVNLRYRQSGILFYPAPIALAALVFSLLVSGLSASIGVLVSLRAGTVRQAQQMMSIGTFVLFLPLLLIQFLPSEWLISIGQVLQNAHPEQIAIWIAVGLLIIETILLLIAKRLFQRSKLILD
jgi:ABC-2 type transport system permease protein